MDSRRHILNIAGFDEDAIAEGPGLRFVLFVQGCCNKCPGCHNPQTHEFGIGQNYYAEDIYSIVKKNPLQTGVTFSGGEPFCQAGALAALGRLLRNDGYDIAVYSGNTFESLFNDDDPDIRDLLSVADILVDGPFIQERQNRQLMFRGSDNQRILDMHKSLKAGYGIWTSDELWLRNGHF